MHTLKLSRVTKIYGSGHTAVTALREANLTVGQGEVVLIMGPSGSGKTTLLSVAGGLLQPTSGEVRLAGQTITGLTEKELPLLRLKHIGFIFQSFNLLSALTVLENVRLVLDLAGAEKRKTAKRATALLEEEGLGGKINRLPKELSGGEAQRVSIARALVNDPDIILADEPTANLDSVSGHKIMMLLKGLAKEKGKSIVIVSHDQRIIDVADRVLWLEDGRLSDRRRSPEEVFRDPVCGLLVNKRETKFSSVYKKKSYYFCSQKCKSKFLKKPEGYLAKSLEGTSK